MKHGFIKVAAATPKITVADCYANLTEILRIFEMAQKEDVKLLVYPELCLTGASCGDLFFSDSLLSAARRALLEFLSKTKNSDTISIIGFPHFVNDKIYNSAAICKNGRVLGIIPKSNLNAEEARYFSRYSGELTDSFFDESPFGTEQIFCAENIPSFKIGVEIGADLYSAITPSTYAALSGATVIACPSAAVEIVGAEKRRRAAVTEQSARLKCGYILSEAGNGESTTDGVFGGQTVIAENGDILAESAPFVYNELTVSEIDVSMLSSERRKDTLGSFGDVEFYPVSFKLNECETSLTRVINAHPFVPADKDELARRCEKILSIQAHGLAQRIIKSYSKKCVIGISGGLDSCLALLATVRAMALLGRPVSDIVCVTMPCFGTTQRTRSNAEILCEEIGCELRCIDIASAVKQHFSDIGHDENLRNVVYENSQARERTQILMDLANVVGGIVVGTGDLSELALGWATYNGDHMSMYGVNGDIPKTLVREIVSYCADTAEADGKVTLARTLRDIVDTPVSPELLPADKDGSIAQKTEDLVGPYEIHDFYIYNTLRYGFTPDKLYRLAKIAFRGVYDDETLKKWLLNFIRRFFAQQFKRSCLPDGPKVGSVGLSPRGDWHMPSDASATEWMRIAERL